MKKFNEWCDRMDAKLKDFEWKDLLYSLFPISIFFKRKQNQFETGKIIHVPTQTLRFKVQKDISQFRKIYGESADIGMSMDMIKKAMVNELTEKIAESGAIEFKSYKRVGDDYFDTQILEAEILIVTKK